MAKYVWGDSQTQFFYDLTPDTILSAVEAVGVKTTGRCIALNSMENRVFEIEIEIEEYKVKSESDRSLIVKFYRPGRWSKEQLLDEQMFMSDLLEAEVPVVAPLKFNGESLFKMPNLEIYYTLFPKKGGRVPEEMNEEQLQIMGRMLARLHNVGSSRQSLNRIKITPESFGTSNMSFLADNKFLPAHQLQAFNDITSQLVDEMNPLFSGLQTHRIHGDCHLGNIIWRESEGPFFIDFDDMLVGPAVQDIWLVVPGNDDYAAKDRLTLLEAYDSMRDFDYNSLKLVEPLRALRYIHFAAWIAKRWDDQAFKTAFPQFENGHYFDILLNDLRHQVQKILEQKNPIPYY